MRKKVFKRIFIFALIFAAVSGAVLVGSFYVVGSSQKLETNKIEGNTTSMTMLDSAGIEIEQSGNFTPVNYSALPAHVKDSFISIEDKDFYKHNGISHKRILKAVFNNLKSGRAKEGASTITQQLIKNTHLTREKTMVRKVQEVFLAKKLEKAYTKDQILEHYFNVVYFGNGIIGLEKAAQFYFSKPAESLSISEVAVLAGLIKSPHNLCPIRNPEKSLSRRNLVLSQMQKYNKITKEQYEAEKKTPLNLNVKDRFNMAHAYLQAASQEAAEILNISVKDLYGYNYKIKTYYDKDVQNAIHNTARQKDYEIKDVSGEIASSAVLAVDNNSYGITGFYSNLSNASQAKRSPASAIKPILVYAPACELGVISPATMLDDASITIDGYTPQNFGGVSVGKLSAREALSKSNNIAAVKILEYVGTKKAKVIAKNLGVTVTNEHLSAALGNTETTFTELAGGYTTLANGGVYKPLKFVESITNRDGKIVYQRFEAPYRAISDDAAYLVTDMLKTCAAEGTAKKVGALGGNVAAKTGTAQRDGANTNTDCYCVAYTPEHTLLVWNGNASMQKQHDLPKGTTGGGLTSFIARDILSAIPKSESLEQPTFICPPSIEEVNLDALELEQGKLVLASNFTPEKFVKKELFCKRFKPKEISKNFITNTAPIINVHVSNGGMPTVSFNALPHISYEIYRNGQLLQSINGNGERYAFVDNNIECDKIYNYHVVAKSLNTLIQTEESSNVVPIIVPKKTERVNNAPQKKHWFF